MYHPDPHSHHTRASTIGHQAPPPPPPLPHLPSSSAAYASLASSSTQPYPPRQPSPAGYPVEPYPTTYQDQHYQPHQQQHFQPPPPLQLHQPHPSNSNLTGAYPHHSRYLKIHSFSPSSSYSYNNNNPLDLFVNCTLFPTSSNKNSPASLDSSHPPAKTIRLCFGSLPLATKVARAPGSAPADAGGQDLLLSCRVPKWEDVVSNGKPGVGGGRVGVHCEILGAGMGGGEERVLERVWFGEFQFLGAGEQVEEQEMGMDVGGWGGGGHARASTHQPLSQKRAGSPLLSHSPQRRHSPGLRTNEMDPYESYQQEFNVVDHHGGGGGQNSPYLQVDLQRPPPGTGSYSYHADPTPQRTYSPSPLIAHHAPPPHSSQSYVSPQPGPSSPQQYWSAPPPPHPSSQPPSSRSATIPTPIVPPSPNQPLTINPQNLSPTTPPNQPHSSLHPGSESTPLMVRTFQLPRTPKAQRATPTSATGGPGGPGGGTGGVKTESPGMVTRAVDGRDTHGVQAGVGGKGGTTKASLLLQGDLGQMAIGWNQEEWASRRRLIQFWRRHEKGTIHAAFRPIAQADYIENSIVISCIYREDTNECYVTSVDTIYLLEALIGVRFSVEEKNRIRRNLEGLKPDTVSKNKPSTEEFFKLVMGLPKPKPRNIEKDVKVFKWANFGDALVKIISKYSVAYEEPRGPASPPKIPGPLQPVPSSSINHIQPPHPSPIYQQYPGPPPPLDPHFQQSPYPYGTSPLPDDRQPREFNHAQPLHARYSSQSSSDNPSMEFSQSASSSSSSLHAGSSYVGTRSGTSAPAASTQPHSSPFAAGRPPLNHHASSTSPASFQTQSQTQSQPPPPPTNQLLPAFHQPSEAGYDFTDYFNPLSENNTPSSSSAMAVPPYPSSTSTTTSATFASSAVPTPSSSGDFAAIGGGASFHIPTSARGSSSSSSFPALEAFDLDPKQAALAGLPSSVASLALGERGGGAAVASGAGGIPGVVRMEEVLKATTAVEEEGSGDELEEDEDEDGDAHGLDL